MDNGHNFRDLMIAAMERSGINPAQLARRSGVRVGVIRDLIRGKAQTTSAENARPIARELGFSLDTGIPTERNAEAEELVFIFSTLPEEFRDRLLGEARIYQRAAGTPEPPREAPELSDDPELKG